MRVAVLVLAVVVSGCAAKVLTTGPRSVVVRAPAMGFDSAQQAAEAECSKHGRHARFAQKLTPVQFSYDCVL